MCIRGSPLYHYICCCIETFALIQIFGTLGNKSDNQSEYATMMLRFIVVKTVHGAKLQTRAVKLRFNFLFFRNVCTADRVLQNSLPLAHQRADIGG